MKILATGVFLKKKILVWIDLTEDGLDSKTTWVMELPVYMT